MRHSYSSVDKSRLLRDVIRSVLLYRVWFFIGVQDIKRRYRRSFIGPLWILLNLGVYVGAIGFVYGVMFGQDLKAFLPYLMLGFVTWGLISSSIVDAGTVFISAEGYIKQFSYPKQIYILRALVSNSMNFVMGLIAVAIVQIFLGTFAFGGWLTAIPGIVLLYLALLGHTTVFSYLGTAIRDLPHALASVLQVVFYLTPIVVPASVLKSHGLELVYLVNPIYHLIEVIRQPILTATLAPMSTYGFILGYVLIVYCIAWYVASRLDKRVVFLL
ncbi:ABC transporter permease [Mesorhizobium sp. M3A.F.Ca.ET.174.01.1.1]|nr:ABC transporter permease [Mesorhizobium sp. M3A.F.Ca.ET.201.01.1.1]TGS87483.1 ABC transporter permease [Mesorhizobium sp. M3A.F.Ca.ET.175.01.1.1]TGT27943.1 ABC transporter permease [Mesorhizobium sp. M3A.F.Ca.ET.174.01.1.1]